MSSKRLKRRKIRLWTEDPHCRNCGIVTVLPADTSGKQAPNAATIQHLRSRLNPTRQEPNYNQQERTTLWCNKCNQEDSKQIVQDAPIELLWQKSGSYPIGHPLAKEISERYLNFNSICAIL